MSAVTVRPAGGTGDRGSPGAAGTTAGAGGRRSIGGRLSAWLFTPVPAGRVAAFRTLAYLFVPLDLLRLTPWVARHADVPGELYRPLFVGRLLHLPVPTETLVQGVWVALLATSLAAATGRAPRALGTAVAVLYAEWMVIAMSYGKVDHDRFGYMLALFALAAAGPARHGETTLTERGGWALRVTQMAAIATYFLAAFAKLRFGGPEWVTSAVLTWAVIRRGTGFGDWLMDIPGALIAMQWFIMAFELGSPLVFLLSERARRWLIVSFYGFHAGVFAAVRIAFFPHLVTLAAFLPLERVRPIAGTRRLVSRLAAGRRAVARPEPTPAG